jgi:transposase
MGHPGDVSVVPPVGSVSADAEFWRAQAETAAARVEELTAEKAALRARVDELTQQVAVLSRLLFGTSSEQRVPGSGGAGDVGVTGQGAGGRAPDENAGIAAGRGRGRGQQRGGPGHGRRVNTHLETEERFHDVPEQERSCGTCGLGFEFLGSEQIDWQVKIIRIVHRRMRYRRRCGCAGPRTVVAPAVAQPIPKGLYTAAFLARLLVEKHVLGRPVHRLVKALTAEGYTPSEGTLSGALKSLFPLLKPLSDAIACWVPKVLWMR